MIFKELQVQFNAAQAVTREFVTLMESTFSGYREIADHLLASLPSHVQQSELQALVKGDLKSRLFDQSFCESIPQALKSLRRAILRLEDVCAEHTKIPKYVNDLGRLSSIVEGVEALYQQHWEYYRYQPDLDEKEVLDFLMRVHQIANHWDAYLGGFDDKAALIQSMHGRPAPEDMASLRVSYHREGPEQFSVGSLKSLVNFLESGYRFVCEIFEIDTLVQPLSLLHVEVADPVELYLALPEQAENAYRRFLQYLFLKDMLKRESLLKFVFEAVEKEHGRAKTLSTTQIGAFLKDLNARVKELPSDGRFTISDRTFPDDSVRVLQEFVVALETQKIPYDAMVRSERKKPAAAKKPAKAPAKVAPDLPAAPIPPPLQLDKPKDQEIAAEPGKPRDHIRILTDTGYRS